MVIKKQVVPQERFESGYRWPDYVETMKSNKERHLTNYAAWLLSEEDQSFFSRAVERAGGALKVILITEDWCPDCYRNAPIIAKLGEMPGIEVRIFPRDSHLDLMDRYLKDGEFRSIPTAVWMDADLGELAVWIERPAAYYEDMPRIQEEVEKLLQEEQRRAMGRLSEEAYQNRWRYEVVRETRERLAQALGL